MDAAQHIVKLGPTAVELVDRTMIDLALANPAFRPTMRDGAASASRRRSCWSSSPATPRRRCCAGSTRLVELMGDLGLPGSVVEMADDAPQKNLWEVRKAGLNIMMSLKGDGKPVSFIEDCAVPLEHLADYTDALTEVFARHGTRGTWYAHASVGTLHVRPILDMRRDGAAKMRAIAEEASRAGAQATRARTAASTATACAAANGSRGSSARRINDAFRAIKHAARSDRPVQPRQDRRSAEDGRRRAVPLPAAAGAGAVPDDRARAGARLVGVGRAERSAHRSDHARRAPAATHRRLRQGGRDVQQQRPLPQVRRRHDVPELSRDARRAAPDPRPRQHAAARALRPARPGCASPARRCTRRWICASAARAASASARPASTWRG